ncbi:hypothetical protein CG723_31560 [Streptomyces sp. CB01635]|uniref:hypothetical protein n=1 Tax=unclassified Streptomyces TaxID=2593676 RepID=UPI000C26FA20|nr:hypothetical protein [Streptomyces sp. CB01635]PJN07916.1 hypothetical protein CG723_31560 [Streptomyces sp. CB01635]
MDPEDAGTKAKFVIRDRDAKYPAVIDEVLAGAGIRTILTSIRMPCMNSVMDADQQSGAPEREVLHRRYAHAG